MVAVSSTIARLEYAMSEMHAPSVISSSRSLETEPSSAFTAGDCVMKVVLSPISRSASNISPRPISTRPKRPSALDWRDMNSTTPTKMNRGESQDRSNEKTTAIRLVPTSAWCCSCRASRARSAASGGC